MLECWQWALRERLDADGVGGKQTTMMTPGTKAPKQKTLDGFLKAKPAATEADGGAGAAGGGGGGEAPVKVTTGLGADKHDKEGRLITVEYASFYVVFAYVPNSGEGLKRIDYRLEEWDKDLRAYLKSLEATKPVVSPVLGLGLGHDGGSVVPPHEPQPICLWRLRVWSHRRYARVPLTRPFFSFHSLRDAYSSVPRQHQNASPRI